MDPDGDTLTATLNEITNNPTGGTINLASDGSFTYIPGSTDVPGDYDVTFTYNVTDGNTSDTASVTISVTAINDAPVITLPTDPQETTEDPASPLTIDPITVDDSDIGDNDFSVVVSVENGVIDLVDVMDVTFTGDGTSEVSFSGTKAEVDAALAAIQYTPDAEFSGETL